MTIPTKPPAKSKIRKIVTFVEETFSEMDRAVDPPPRVALPPSQ